MIFISPVRLSWSVTSPPAPPCSTNSRMAGGASGLWWARSRWPQPCVRVWFSPCDAWTSPWWSQLHLSPSCDSGRSSSIQRATSLSWGCSRRLRCEGILPSSVSFFFLAALSLHAGSLMWWDTWRTCDPLSSNHFPPAVTTKQFEERRVTFLTHPRVFWSPQIKLW